MQSSQSWKCLEMAQSLAHMLLLGKSGNNVTSNVHAVEQTMPEANCSIFGCGVSRKPKYQGIGIFKIPPASDKSKESWRKALLHVVTQDRVVDASFRKQIVQGDLHICERHFEPEEVKICKYP